MDAKLAETPRKYVVGLEKDIVISDMGRLQLAPDEQVTFETDSGAEYDVCRKDWGFYATPSVNGRLARFGFKTALVCNASGDYYVMLVESAKRESFERYCARERNSVVEWLDERKRNREK